MIGTIDAQIATIGGAPGILNYQYPTGKALRPYVGIAAADNNKAILSQGGVYPELTLPWPAEGFLYVAAKMEADFTSIAGNLWIWGGGTATGGSAGNFAMGFSPLSGLFFAIAPFQDNLQPWLINNNFPFPGTFTAESPVWLGYGWRTNPLNTSQVLHALYCNGFAYPLSNAPRARFFTVFRDIVLGGLTSFWSVSTGVDSAVQVLIPHAGIYTGAIAQHIAATITNPRLGPTHPSVPAPTHFWDFEHNNGDTLILDRVGNAHLGVQASSQFPTY